MKEEFNKSILKLDSNQYAAICVEYKDGMGNYQSMKFTTPEGATTTSATKNTLIAIYGSVEAFLEQLFAKGIKELRITDRYKNGSSFKTIGTPYEVIFEAPNQPKEKPIEPVEVTEPANQPQQHIIPNYGMMGSANGLSGADIHKIYDHERLRVENSDLKLKNDYLTKENEKLSKENLTLELLGAKSVEKSKAQAELLEKGTGYMPLIMKIMEGKNATTPGLTGATSELKQAYLNMPDEVLEEIYPVLKGYSIPEFQIELDNLLKKHNLIQQ